MLEMRNWKGRDRLVMGRKGLSLTEVRDLTDFHFPEHMEDETTLRAYANYVGMQMRFSASLVEAMIWCRLVKVGNTPSLPELS